MLSAIIMTPSELIKALESLHPLENRVLLCFTRGEAVPASDIMRVSGLDESRLDMAAGWLQSKGLLRVAGEAVATSVSLTETGAEYKEKGTPEIGRASCRGRGEKFT